MEGRNPEDDHPESPSRGQERENPIEPNAGPSQPGSSRDPPGSPQPGPSRHTPGPSQPGTSRGIPDLSQPGTSRDPADPSSIHVDAAVGDDSPGREEEPRPLYVTLSTLHPLFGANGTPLHNLPNMPDQLAQLPGLLFPRISDPVTLNIPSFPTVVVRSRIGHHFHPYLDARLGNGNPADIPYFDGARQDQGTQTVREAENVLNLDGPDPLVENVILPSLDEADRRQGGPPAENVNPANNPNLGGASQHQGTQTAESSDAANSPNLDGANQPVGNVNPADNPNLDGANQPLGNVNPADNPNLDRANHHQGNPPVVYIGPANNPNLDEAYQHHVAPPARQHNPENNPDLDRASNS